MKLSESQLNQWSTFLEGSIDRLVERWFIEVDKLGRSTKGVDMKIEALSNTLRIVKDMSNEAKTNKKNRTKIQGNN